MFLLAHDPAASFKPSGLVPAPSRRALLAATAASCLSFSIPGSPKGTLPAHAFNTPLPAGWTPLDEVDIGLSAFKAVESEFSVKFSALFARFLVNNEDLTRRWWEQKQREAGVLPSKELQETYLLSTFSQLIASVELGLERFEDASGSTKLASILQKRYKSPTEKRQLAQLLALVDQPSLQPVGTIRSLLAEADNARVESLSLIGAASNKSNLYLLQSDDPQVIISPPPAVSGRTAKAKPVLRPTGRWRGVQIVDAGYGYAQGEEPKVQVGISSSNSGSDAKSVRPLRIRATTRNGSVDRLILEDVGSGYLNADGLMPSLELLLSPPAEDSSLSRAARATLLPEYELCGLELLDGGSGYNIDEPAVVMIREPVAVTVRQGLKESQTVYSIAVNVSMKAANVREEATSQAAMRALEEELLDASRFNGLPLLLEARRGSGKNGMRTLPSSLLPRYDEEARVYRLPISIPAGAFGKRADVPVEQQPQLSLSEVARIFASGALCSGTAHTVLVPIDVVKTALQQDPERYVGPVECAKDLVAKDGFVGGLLRGAGSTWAGYSIAGALSFGLVEVFGRALRSATGPGIALLFGPPLLIAASAAATVICTIAVCPFEAVRVQSVKSGKAGLDVLKEILEVEGIASLYRGIAPILLKEVPFVVTKFLVFNAMSDLLKSYVENAGFISTPVLATELTVLAGALAGLAAVFVSQPADAVFTLANDGPGMSVMSAVEQVKERPRLIVDGLETRLLFGVLLVTLQFFFYTQLRATLGVSKDDLTIVWDALSPLRS